MNGQASTHNDPMKILFWGTPAYAVPSLEALVKAGHTLVGVVSQPDRRRGRGIALVASPVKARASAAWCSGRPALGKRPISPTAAR
mgnify:CR=1 FL=1